MFGTSFWLIISILLDCIFESDDQKRSVTQTSEKHLETYERDLNGRINEIKALVDQKRMKQIVGQWKAILAKTKSENRDQCSKTLAIVEKQPRVFMRHVRSVRSRDTQPTSDEEDGGR